MTTRSRSSEPLHVVLIEDDHDCSELYRLGLEQEGIEVLAAHDCRSGLELVLAVLPDAVVLDLTLPDGSGMRILETLKKDPATRGIPVAILTADSGQFMVRLCKKLGAIDYVVKHASTPAKLAGMVPQWVAASN